MSPAPFADIPPEHLEELKRMAEAGEIPKRKLHATPLPDDERAKREAAMQELAELTEELGLYDGEPESYDAAVRVLDNVELVTVNLKGRCPFCGAAMPCVSHRPGG